MLGWMEEQTIPAGAPPVRGCTLPIPLHFLPLHLRRIPEISALRCASFPSACDFFGGDTLEERVQGD